MSEVEQTKLGGRGLIERRIEAALAKLDPGEETEGPLLARYCPYERVQDVPAEELGNLCAQLEKEPRFLEILGEGKYLDTRTAGGKLGMYRAAIELMETALKNEGFGPENGITFSQFKIVWNDCLKSCVLPGVSLDVQAEETMACSAPEKVPEKAPKKAAKSGTKKRRKTAAKTMSPMERKTVQAVVQYLNQKTGRAFKPGTAQTQRHIVARLRDGFTLDDLCRVVDDLNARWNRPPLDGAPDMRPYLRPETMFGGKFEGYLNDAGLDASGAGPKRDCLQETYFNPIERKGKGEAI